MATVWSPFLFHAPGDDKLSGIYSNVQDDFVGRVLTRHVELKAHERHQAQFT
jgi:hypothetical protein